MNSHSDGEQTIEFKQQLPVFARVFFILFALLPLLVPFELVIRPLQMGKPGVVQFIAILLSLGAILLSIFFVYLAIFGRSETFRFDGAGRNLTYQYRHLLIANRSEIIPFAKIECLEVREHVWDSGPATYSLGLKVAGRPREFLLGNFGSRGEAVKNLLGVAALGIPTRS